jgi:farnesol dehydrogenase
MSIFITGGTGYIGAHLLKRLADSGEKIHVLVRSEKKATNIEHPNVAIFEGDIMNKDSIRDAMQGCNKVYHLAAFAKVWAKDPKIYFDINVSATVNILEVAQELDVSKVIVTSTAGVYGASVSDDITETYVRDFDFFNEYESSKAISESRVKDFVIAGLNVSIVSPTRVYGPYLFGQPQSVTQLIHKYVKGNWRIIPGDGTKIGNYVFVDDVIDGHILAMEKGRKGHTYILGGENHDYNSFFKILAIESGIYRKMIKLPIGFQMLFSRIQLMKIPFGGTPLITPKWIAKGKHDWKVDANKAINELGLKVTSLQEGVKKTIDWVEGPSGKK